VIEDAPAGIRSGKSAMMKVVAVRTTATDSELRDAGADWIVNNCADLKIEKSVGNRLVLGVKA